MLSGKYDLQFRLLHILHAERKYPIGAKFLGWKYTKPQRVVSFGQNEFINEVTLIHGCARRYLLQPSGVILDDKSREKIYRVVANAATGGGRRAQAARTGDIDNRTRIFPFVATAATFISPTDSTKFILHLPTKEPSSASSRTAIE